MATDLTGKNLGPFIIESRLGQGAMGTVYRARYTKTGKLAAIKVMSSPEEAPHPVLAARFEREIKVLSQFRHPNIVRIYGASDHDNIRYYAMELIEGKPLDEVLKIEKRLSLPRTIVYMKQLCEALQEIHNSGIVHRDLKPANLMVSDDHKLKLTDFGIAKDTTIRDATALTRADQTIGTVAYMSPEQLAGQELNGKSDLYSLGIVMYRLLAGRLPFAGDTMFEYMNQRMEGTYPLPSAVDREIPKEVDDLISELLAQDAADRPRDAYMVLQRLIDIEKALKEGTLTKAGAGPKKSATTTKKTGTSTKSARGEESTKSNTLIRTITQTIVGKKKDPDEAFRELITTWGPITLLTVVLIGALIYFLKPPSADALFAKGEAKMKSDNAIDYQSAFTDYFDPLLKRFPNYEKKDKIEAYRDTLVLEQAKGRANRVLKLGLKPDNPSEAETQYIQAIKLTDDNQLDLGVEKLRAVVNLFNDPKDRGWKLLATRKLEELEKTGVKADDRRGLVEKLEALVALTKQGKNTEAQTQYADLLALHKGNPKFADLAPVFDQYAIYGLHPDQLYARGQELMGGANLADWKRGVKFYLSPHKASYPGKYAMEIEKAIDKVAMTEANNQLKGDMVSGVPKSASAAETLFVASEVARATLGDEINAYSWYFKVAELAKMKAEDRGWELLARERIESIKMPDQTPEDFKPKKREAAERAMERAKRMLERDPKTPFADWHGFVLQAYRNDADVADLIPKP